MPDVTILNDGDETIATVVPPTVMEEKPPEVAVASGRDGEPEVIAKGKKDEEGAPTAEGKEKEKKEEKGKK